MENINLWVTFVNKILKLEGLFAVDRFKRISLITRTSLKHAKLLGLVAYNTGDKTCINFIPAIQICRAKL